MNPASTFIIVSLCLFVLLTPRRFLLVPFIMVTCMVPMNQRIVLLGLDFTLLRILVLFGFFRVFLKGEQKDIQWNSFDKLLILWVLFSSVALIIQQMSITSIINRMGFMFDILGMYWLFRQGIHDWREVGQTVNVLAFFAIMSAPLILMEKLQIFNFYDIFGPTQGQFHRGRFRAAGPFPHYIMMGCFWASLLPFFYARIKRGAKKPFYWAAILASLVSVYCSASSTPVFTVIAIIIFWKLYNYRHHGKSIFWLTIALLTALHLAMKAPVWHLIARIDIFGGSTGWHRYHLFDQFINRIAEWFLIGTKSTGHWGYGLEDVTNQFVLEGVRGGIVPLTLFILLVYRAVKIPGALSLANLPDDARWMSWGICVAMLGHFVTFWGVSYFGQMNMLLYFVFAMVGFCQENRSEQEVTLSVHS